MNYNEYISEGKKHFSTKNYSAALGCIKKAIQCNPNLKEAYLLEAMSWQHLGGICRRNALSALYKILAIDPEDSIVKKYIDIVSSNELLSQRIEIYPTCYDTLTEADDYYHIEEDEFIANFIEDVTMKFKIIDGNSLEIVFCIYDKQCKGSFLESNTKEKNDIIIPSSINYDSKIYTIKEIGKRAFQGLDGDSLPKLLTNIEIPNTITKIKEEAFSDCHFLKSIRIPESVTKIEKGAFSYCSSLENIEVDEGNSIYDSRNNCNAIIETKQNKIIFGCKNTKIPKTVTAIGFAAFHGQKKLETIEIPNTITSIEQSAFIDTGLRKIELPNSLSSIEKLVFSHCDNLQTINFGTSITTIKDSAFKNNHNLNTIMIPKSVKEIGQMAFYDCKFKSISLGDSLTLIGDYAFNCHHNPFDHNTNLYTLEIPKTVKNIGLMAFSPKNIQSIKVHEDNPFFDSRNNCDAIIETNTDTLILGCSKTSIPNSIKHIGERAFFECESLYEVSLPNSVETIGDESFSFCENLCNVILPDSILKIGRAAFNMCKNLTEIIIPQNVSYIGEQVFNGCKKLKSITCLNSRPPYLQSDTLFNSSDLHTYYDYSAFNVVVLRVPHSCIDNYKNAPGWKLFKNIIAIE